MAGLKDIPSGPFIVGPSFGEKKRGLLWIGVPEQCDRCKEIWPMAWVAFDGKHFLCTACDWDVTVEHRSVEGYTVSEDANLIEVCCSCYKYFDIGEMTISYNELICRKCAWKRASKIQYDLSCRAEEERRKRLQAELEADKLLSPEEREKREIERQKAYYDRMCS